MNKKEKIENFNKLTKNKYNIENFIINLIKNDSYDYSFHKIQEIYQKIKIHKKSLDINSILKINNFLTLEKTINQAIDKINIKRVIKENISQKHKDFINYEIEQILTNFLSSELDLSKEKKLIIIKKTFNHISKFKSPIEFKLFLATELLNILKFNKNSLMKTIKNNNLNIVFDKKNIVIIEVKNFETAKLIGSQFWCITKSFNSFNLYLNKDSIFFESKLFFYFDFNKELTDKNKMLAFMIKKNAIINKFDYYNNPSNINIKSIISLKKLNSQKQNYFLYKNNIQRKYRRVLLKDELNKIREKHNNFIKEKFVDIKSVFQILLINFKGIDIIDLLMLNIKNKLLFNFLLFKLKKDNPDFNGFYITNNFFKEYQERNNLNDYNFRLEKEHLLQSLKNIMDFNHKISFDLDIFIKIANHHFNFYIKDKKELINNTNALNHLYNINNIKLKNINNVSFGDNIINNQIMSIFNIKYEKNINTYDIDFIKTINKNYSLDIWSSIFFFIFKELSLLENEKKLDILIEKYKDWKYLQDKISTNEKLKKLSECYIFLTNNDQWEYLISIYNSISFNINDNILITNSYS